MSQTVQTQFGTGTVVDHEVIRGRVSYKVEGPGFSTWIEAAAMPLDFQMMPHPDDVQDNSVTLPYNPSPQSWVNPADQNIVPGEQAINPEKRTAPADSVDFQADGESYEPGPDPRLFATGGLSPEDIQAKLGPKYVNAFVEHDFTSLQARIDENPELVMAEYRERVAELVAQADQDYLERVGRNEALESSDPHIREAAWKDVRAKAVRLRKSGQVMTHAANPDIIASQVTGDHGTYEVMVIRSNIFQGSSAVDSWTCECPWGQWAFVRDDKFLGRMCSHAYASLMELQAMTRSKTPNPRFRDTPGIGFDISEVRNRVSARTAESMDVETAIDYARDNVYDTLAENGLDIHDPEAYDLIQETWRSSLGMYEDMYGLEIPEEVYNRYASRTAEVVDIGTKIFHRDYADIYGTVIEDDGTAYLVADGPGGEYWIDHEDARLASRTAEMVDIRPVGWDPYARNLMNRLRDLWEEGSRPGQQKKRNEEIRELVQELRDRGYATDGIMAARESFLSRPMGYEDIPDYGTSEDYILEHELENREDVTEPEFEYPAGGDHGVVNDINDGKRTADISWDEYGSGDEFGGDEDPFYVDPMEREDYPEDYSGGDFFDGGEDPNYVDPAEQEDIVANFQKNAGYASSNWHSVNVGEWEVRWDYKDATYPNENPQAEIIVFVDFECEVRIWDSSGHLIEDYVVNIEDGGDPRGEQVRREVDLKVQQMYEKDSAQAPGQMELWGSRTEEDVVANFQRNAGYLLEGGSDGGGNDDIAAAAEAHLKVAGRHFTMAEQQELIDETDGKPYDRSQLNLRGTHYEH